MTIHSCFYKTEQGDVRIPNKSDHSDQVLEHFKNTEQDISDNNTDEEFFSDNSNGDLLGYLINHNQVGTTSTDLYFSNSGSSATRLSFNRSAETCKRANTSMQNQKVTPCTIVLNLIE